MGAVDCAFVAEGETNDEVKGKMMAHAQEAHPDKIASMSDADKAGMDAKMDEMLNAQM